MAVPGPVSLKAFSSAASAPLTIKCACVYGPGVTFSTLVSCDAYNYVSNYVFDGVDQFNKAQFNKAVGGANVKQSVCVPQPPEQLWAVSDCSPEPGLLPPTQLVRGKSSGFSFSI